MKNSQEEIVSIIIPTFNGKHLLEQSINSALSQSYANTVVVIVDNGSTDGTNEFIQENYSEIEYIQLSKNLGYVGAVNAGIRAADTNYVAILNNDAVADSNWIEMALAVFHKNKEIACVTPKILSFYDNRRIDSSGDVMNTVGQASSRGEGDVDCDKYNVSKFVFSASGCSPVYQTKCLKEIGIFDDIYFAYFEDLDLSWRIQKSGYLIWYCSEATVLHRRRATSGKVNDIGLFLFRNTVICYLVNTPLKLLFIRRSIIKMMLVAVHTTFWLFFVKKSNDGFFSLKWIFSNTHIIKSMRTNRLPSVVSDAYLDAWREEKKLKFFNLVV